MQKRQRTLLTLSSTPRLSKIVFRLRERNRNNKDNS